MGKRIGIALAIALVLGGTYFTLVRKQGREARKGRIEAQLLSFDDRSITGLTLTTGGVAWRCVRDPRGWRIASPVSDAADAAAVDELVGAARRAPVVQTIASPEALASYGLDPPRATLALEGAALPAIDVGNATPAG